MSSLKKRVAKATFWNLLTNLATGLVRFVTTAVLAHLLTPDDFGLVGVAFIVFGLVSIFGNIGLGAALIYRKDLDDSYYSIVFWATLVFGFALALLIIISAYPASIFFKAPKVFPLLLTLSVTFIINGLSSIHSIKLQKEMNYKKIGFGVFISTVLSSVIAVILAYNNFGVWCLIIQSILWSVLNSLWLIIVVRWVPKFIFDIQKFFELFRYSRNLFFQEIINYFSQNLDYFIIGRKLGTQGLGYYKMAYSVPHIMYDEFTKRITPILFPLLCKVQDDDSVFKKSYLSAIKFSSMIVFPIMGTFIFVARPFILTVYGYQWELIIPTVKILALVAILKSVVTFSGSVYNAKGRPDIGLKFNLIQFPFVAIALLVGAIYGINGVAVGLLVISVFGTIVSVYILEKISKIITTKDVILALFPASMTAILTYFILDMISIFIGFEGNLPNLAFNVLVAVIVIIMIYVTLFVRVLKEFVIFVRKVF